MAGATPDQSARTGVASRQFRLTHQFHRDRPLHSESPDGAARATCPSVRNRMSSSCLSPRPMVQDPYIGSESTRPSPAKQAQSRSEGFGLRATAAPARRASPGERFPLLHAHPQSALREAAEAWRVSHGSRSPHRRSPSTFPAGPASAGPASAGPARQPLQGRYMSTCCAQRGRRQRGRWL